MQAKVSRKGHYWVVHYEGDTVGLLPGPLPEVLDALQNGAHEVILDFSELRFLNPNGIKALRESLSIARNHEANIGITSPQPQVRRALKLSGLIPDIPIYFSQLEAMNKLDLIDYQDDARTELMDRLLICQKDEPVARYLRECLKKLPSRHQFRMIPVRDLKRAFQILLEEKVDCILIDATFPLFQVTQFIEKVAIDNHLPRIPFIVVTGDDRMSEAELMIKNGANEILRMPLQPIEVIVRLQTVISHMKEHKPFVPIEEAPPPPRGMR